MGRDIAATHDVFIWKRRCPAVPFAAGAYRLARDAGRKLRL